MSPHYDPLKLCRVCGLEQANPPWGRDGGHPSHAICPCCGTEFGYDDVTDEAIITTRERWLMEGAEWFLPDRKPVRWKAQKQLANLRGTIWSPSS
jgi:hypothetical protein